MDYGQIIKRSWEIVKKNRFLWWLGILVAFSGGFGAPSFNFSGLNGFSPSGSSTGSTSQSADFSRQFSDFISNINVPVAIIFVLIALAVALVVYLVVFYFSLSAKAGLVVSVDKIEKQGGVMGFRSAMREGKRYFWRLFGLMWLVSLAMFVLVLPVIALIILLVFWHPVAALVGFGLLIFVGFIAIIVLGVLLTIVLLFTQIMIVLEDKKVFVSIRDSYHLIKRNLKDVVIGYAIMMGISFLIGLAMVLLVLVAVALLILIGIIFALAGKVAIIGYVIVAVVASVISVMIATGFITAFTSAYWTLLYRALRYVDSKKTESSSVKESLLQAPTV